MWKILRSARLVDNLASRQAQAQVRTLATRTTNDSQELRARLMSDIKVALKAKDTLTATTLRSVLADIQAADKVHKEGQVDASAIRLFIAKGISRRHEAASQYDKAKRPELATKERREAEILQALLPPKMTDAQIDGVLEQIITSLSSPPKQPSLGMLFKSFYAQIDKSIVPPDVLKRRAQALLSAASQT